MICCFQDDEYLASLQADREKEQRAREEAEAREEEEKRKEEESHRKLEEEQVLLIDASFCFFLRSSVGFLRLIMYNSHLEIINQFNVGFLR